MRRLLACGVLALLAGASAGQTAPSDTLTVEAYAAELTALIGELERSEAAAAAARAQRLLEAQVEHDGERVATDRTVLAPVVSAAPGPSRALVRRLEVVRASLPGGPAPEEVRPDAELLERVRQEQAQETLPEGGIVDVTAIAEVPLLERVAQAIADAVGWVVSRIGDFLRWLVGLLPSRAAGGAHGMTVLLWVVGGILLAVLVGLVIVAVQSLLRREARTRHEGAAEPPPRTAADEDPLSRTASEWERYAEELARAGRLREAVRASFHGVLVTFYAAGLLHPRKGRTNWEHVAGLPATLPFRARFSDLTREFERRWYGMAPTSAEDFASFAKDSRVLRDASRAARAA